MTATNREAVDAILALHDSVRAEWDRYYDVDAPHAQLRDIARRLCEAEGFKPDDVVMGGDSGWVPCRGAKGSVVILFPIRPQWALYLRQAEAALKAVLPSLKAPNGS